MEVLSALLAVLYCRTPSIQSSECKRVPVTVEFASTCTGEVTVDPFAGEQRLTPGELGAVQDDWPLKEKVALETPLWT